MIREESFMNDDAESTSIRANTPSELGITHRGNLATPRLGLAFQPSIRIAKLGGRSECFSPSTLRRKDIQDDDDCECSVADKVSMLKNASGGAK